MIRWKTRERISAKTTLLPSMADSQQSPTTADSEQSPPMADSQQSPPKADSQPLAAPLTGSLRSDIVLFSTLLSGKQSDSSESHPNDANLTLFVDISTLLAIGSAHSPQAQNVNAVLGKITQTGVEEIAMEFLVCAENGEHLQDLFNVITSLRHGDASDLRHFQYFIHHRAYRKLGWRVLEFSTHWGKSPFDIISDHLADPDLKPASFQFPRRSSIFHETIGEYVTPKSMTEQEPDYPLNSDNAPQWLELLQSAWTALQSELLVENSKRKNDMMVRTDSPSTKSVHNIAKMMLILEDLLDVLIHLLSADGAAQALASAGKLESSFTSGCCAHAFPEFATYSKKSGISDPSAIESNTMLDENEADDMELELGLPPVSCESCHLQCSSLCVTSIVQFSTFPKTRNKEFNVFYEL